MAITDFLEEAQSIVEKENIKNKTDMYVFEMLKSYVQKYDESFFDELNPEYKALNRANGAMTARAKGLYGEARIIQLKNIINYYKIIPTHHTLSYLEKNLFDKVSNPKVYMKNFEIDSSREADDKIKWDSINKITDSYSYDYLPEDFDSTDAFKKKLLRALQKNIIWYKEDAKKIDFARERIKKMKEAHKPTKKDWHIDCTVYYEQ